MESLVYGSLGVEREPCVNLGGNLARNDLEDLFAKLNEQGVQSAVGLVFNGTTSGPADLDGSINELLVLRLLRSGKDQGRVGRSILRFVLVNGSKVTRVTNNDLRGNQRGLSCNLNIPSYGAGGL